MLRCSLLSQFFAKIQIIFELCTILANFFYSNVTLSLCNNVTIRIFNLYNYRFRIYNNYNYYIFIYYRLCTRHGLNVTKLHCYNVTINSIRRIRAENRGNWRAKIWNEPKKVVPLHCQNEGEK